MAWSQIHASRSWVSRSVRDAPIWRNVLLLLVDGNSEVSGRDARMSDDDPSKVNIESTTHTLHPDYHGSNVHKCETRHQQVDCLTAWEGFLICASLLIGTKWAGSGVEGRFGTVSCWFILQQLATLPDTFVFPRAINRGVVWFAINQSSHKYPTEAKTAKVSW